MINKIINRLEKYCKDYKNIENYEAALKSPLKYDLHHRREISENKSRKDLIAQHLYYGRPATELIFLSKAEHMRLHNANLSAETRRKISDAKKGDKNPMFGKPSPWLGKHPSAETRQKISDARKGKRSPNRGKHWQLENGKRVWID